MSQYKVRCELEYEVPLPVVFLLNVRAQNSGSQMILEENFYVPPGLEHTELVCLSSRNLFDRLRASTPGIYRITYEATVNLDAEKVRADELPDTSHDDFNLSHLPYLYPSRYCQSDRLGRMAHSRFANAGTPVQQVQAVVDWIHEKIAYVSGSSTANTSAEDTLVDRAGVCRDFAHLGIALCRALNIPARYFTGYAHELQPPDFHACFETWLGGRWVLWDATRLSFPERMIRIGTGRDAADVSVCTSFGTLLLCHQLVVCEALAPCEQEADGQSVIVCHDTRHG